MKGRNLLDIFVLLSWESEVDILYISVVFGSIALKLCDLGQTFWMCFNKLLTIVGRNLGSFPPDRIVVTEPSLYATLFTQAFSALPIGSRSDLCDGHSKTLFVMLQSLHHHVASLLVLCLFRKPVCSQAFISWLMSWDVASVFHHLFCKVYQSLLQQNNPVTWCSYLSFEMVISGLQASPFIVQM